MLVVEVPITAETIKDAQTQLDEKIRSSGSLLLSKRIVSDGKLREVIFHGETTQDALNSAKRSLQPDAKVVAEIVLADTQHTTETISAYSQEEAEKELRQRKERSGFTIYVRQIDLIKQGGNGLLGFGRKPNEYKLHFDTWAKVKIQYQTPAKIIAKLGVYNSEDYIGQIYKQNKSLQEQAIENLVLAKCAPIFSRFIPSRTNDFKSNNLANSFSYGQVEKILEYILRSTTAGAVVYTSVAILHKITVHSSNDIDIQSRDKLVNTIAEAYNTKSQLYQQIINRYMITDTLPQVADLIFERLITYEPDFRNSQFTAIQSIKDFFRETTTLAYMLSLAVCEPKAINE